MMFADFIDEFQHFRLPLFRLLLATLFNSFGALATRIGLAVPSLPTP